MSTGLNAIPRSWSATIEEQAKLRALQRQELKRHVDDWQDERTSLASYLPAVHRTDTGQPAIPPRHLKAVIDAIEDDSLGHTLIIAPPGSAKTNTCIGACGWWAGQEPTTHLGYLSSTAEQAARRSVAIRDTIGSNTSYRAIFPEALPDRLKGWSEREWFLGRDDVGDKDPTMLAVGVLGAIQGSRLNRAIMDDIADPKNMATPYLRQKIIAWIKDSVMTRLTPRGRLIMICTRWAVDDPAGWAIKQGWSVVRIRAVDYSEDEGGKSYWPERWPINTLACPFDRHGEADPEWVQSSETPEPPCWVVRGEHGEIVARGRCAKSQMTAKDFNLVYQGETTDEASAIFKRRNWQSYDLRWRENGSPIIPVQGTGMMAGLFVDTAHTEKTSSDYTVIAPWYFAPPRFFLADIIRRRLEFPELLSLLKDLTRVAAEEVTERGRDGIERRIRKQPGPYRFLPIYVEATPGALPLIQALERDGFVVIPWAIEGRDKMARANSVAVYQERGYCYLPATASWRQDFEEEHAAFPDGENDDQVDTTTMALLEFTGGGSLTTY